MCSYFIPQFSKLPSLPWDLLTWFPSEAFPSVPLPLSLCWQSQLVPNRKTVEFGHAFILLTFTEHLLYHTVSGTKNTILNKTRPFLTLMELIAGKTEKLNNFNKMQ
jgi:hypothetical protein